jgi:hypothetical protein
MQLYGNIALAIVVLENVKKVKFSTILGHKMAIKKSQLQCGCLEVVVPILESADVSKTSLWLQPSRGKHLNQVEAAASPVDILEFAS